MHPQGNLSHMLNPLKVVTLLVSQASSELKAVALANVLNMLVTALVSQTSGWLNALAAKNMSSMRTQAQVSLGRSAAARCNQPKGAPRPLAALRALAPPARGKNGPI